MHRYFEDLYVGFRQDAGSVSVDEAQIIAFAQAYDPQPMHADRDAAERGQFKGLIASGWHTAALVMRQIALAKPFGDTEVLGLAVENLRWHMPVRPGDTLHVEMEVVSATPSGSKQGFGKVKFTVTTRNQKGQVVMVHSPVCWVPRRP